MLKVVSGCVRDAARALSRAAVGARTTQPKSRTPNHQQLNKIPVVSVACLCARCIDRSLVEQTCRTTFDALGRSGASML